LQQNEAISRCSTWLSRGASQSCTFVATTGKHFHSDTVHLISSTLPRLLLQYPLPPTSSHGDNVRIRNSIKRYPIQYIVKLIVFCSKMTTVVRRRHLCECIVLWMVSSVHGAKQKNDDVATTAATLLCNSTNDCGGSSYCASGICLEASRCTVREDCFNQDNTFDSLACEGIVDCTEDGGCACDISANMTGMELCSQLEILPCYVEMCENAIQCHNDNFEGCHATFFDQAGNQACKDKSQEYANESAPICSIDSDCNDTEYCAGGFCLEISTCNQRLDCHNPANFPYAALACVGYPKCLEGQCLMECGDSFCPDGIQEVQCDPLPCNTEDCPDAVSCHNENCGQCQAIFFDAAGKQVCTSTTDLNGNNTSNTTSTLGDSIHFLPCTQDDDCLVASSERSIDKDFFCGGGLCLEKGTCRSDSDCDNPQNEYDNVYCVGYNTCDNGVCTRVCGMPCSDGSLEQVCEPNPCDIDSHCPGSVSCRNDACNGCSAIFYDAAGHEINSCQTTADTTGENEPADQASRHCLAQVLVLLLGVTCGIFLLI
jgi:hypothetical protein